MDEALKKQEAQMKEMSKEMPAVAIRQMEKVLKRMFAEQNVPYDLNSLRASLVMCSLILPNLPPTFSQFISSATLLLYRLIDELETGAIPSEFIIPKEKR